MQFENSDVTDLKKRQLSNRVIQDTNYNLSKKVKMMFALQGIKDPHSFV